MSGDIRAQLDALGIELKHYRPGEHRAACSWCAKGKSDTALAVRIDQDGATWFCHRCQETGGARHAPERRTTPARREPKPEPERHETLSDWGRVPWENSRPIERDTVAGRYLTGRGCRLPPPETHLRWHPALSDLVSGYTGPALVGLVTDAETGEAVNLHRTWLAADGSCKAPIDKPRRLLKGHRSRGVIRLWPDDEVAMGLVLGEGIETCLAAARARIGPVWAVMSAGNLASFPVLPGIEGITILVDHDKPNPRTGKRAGHEAARELIERYTAAGFDPERDIQCLWSDVEGEDIADLVKDGEL